MTTTMTAMTAAGWHRRPTRFTPPAGRAPNAQRLALACEQPEVGTQSTGLLRRGGIVGQLASALGTFGHVGLGVVGEPPRQHAEGVRGERRRDRLVRVVPPHGKRTAQTARR